MASFMPSKASLTAATASNALYNPKNRPVGVFLGGTSGIGQAMAEQLAKQTNGCARIVIMGRNQVAADRIIAGFPKTSASTPTEEASDYSFIKVDATSIAQIRDVTSKLSKDLDKINFIVTTAGFMTLKGRDETSEGLDRKMACNFYARFRLIQDLIPLVEKAVEMGEQTGVVNVLAPGRGGPITTEDLGLVKTYGSINARYHAIAYNDVAFEKFSQLHSNIGFYHIFPGVVTTPMITGFPGAKLVMPLFRWITVTPAESAQARRIFIKRYFCFLWMTQLLQIMWWRAWSGEADWKTGSHRINQRGEELPLENNVSEEGKKEIWEHAVKMTS